MKLDLITRRPEPTSPLSQPASPEPAENVGPIPQAAARHLSFGTGPRMPRPVHAPREVEDLPIMQLLKSGIMTESIIGGADRWIERLEALKGVEDDPNYDLFADPLVKDHPALLQHMIGSESAAETQVRVKQFIDLRRMERELASDPAGTVAAMAGALLNPTTFVPFAGPYKGATVLQRMGTSGAMALSIAIPEEAFLSANAPTRTAATSLFSIAALTGAGGVFGAVRAPGPVVNPARTTTPLRVPSGADIRDLTPTAFMRFENRPSTVGAQEIPNPGHRRSFEQQLADEALAETGVEVAELALEKIPWNPVFRLQNSFIPEARRALSDLVDLGGLIRKKNLRGVATERSVETDFRLNHLKPLVDAITRTDALYLEFRGKMASASISGRVFQVAGQRIQDSFARLRGGRAQLTPEEFRREIGRAMRRNDEHEIPQVAEAARFWREHLIEPIKTGAREEQLFERGLKNQLFGLRKAMRETNEELKAARQAAANTGEITARQTELETQLEIVQRKIDRLVDEGPSTNTAASYFPRIYRHDKIMQDRQAFRRILVDWLRTRRENLEVPVATLSKEADELIDRILLQRPYLDLEQTQALDRAAEAGAFRERILEIPDDLIEDYLENDAEMVLRYYSRTTGMDIELSRRFGDISMKGTLDDVKASYQARIDAAGDAEKAVLKKRRDRDLRDLAALRDRLRGTYGLPSDPFRPISRAVRIAKTVNVLTMMGGAAVSALPDLARVVMTEGLENTYGAGLKALFQEGGERIRKLSQHELRAAGEGLDMVLGLRALQMADIGDVFGRRYALERGLIRATGPFFLMNGLHLWNTAAKEWASVVISHRILTTARKFAKGAKLSELDKARLARSGIDDDLAARITAEVRVHGETINGVRMPNTDMWTDLEAARAFRGALSQDVNRTIVTPGAGDRALWTSTEFGSLIAQFKSFGQGATQRVLIAGLQERDANFMLGSALLVSMGFLVNELKRSQFGDTRKQSFPDAMIDAVDRSGILGWFTDANNTFERVMNHKAGLRPLLVGPKPYDPSFRAKVSSILGPTGNTFDNLTQVTSDILSGNVGPRTGERAQRLLPGNNIPWLQPGFDAAREAAF